MSLGAVDTVLRALPEPHLLVSSRGEILAVNPAAARLLGLRGDATGASLLQWVADPAERVRAYLESCSGTTSPLPGALSFHSPDGQTRKLRCRGALVKTAASPAVLVLQLEPDGGPVERFQLLTDRVDGLAREVRERRRMEAELRETMARLEGTVRASPLAIIGVNLHGEVTVWNPAAERIFGWSAQEVLGRPLPIVPEEEREDFERRWALVQQGRALVGVRTRRARKDGSRVDVSISSAPVLDPDARLHGAIAVLEDISARLRAEETLRESEAFNQRLLESSGDCVKVLDLQARLLSMNRAGQQILRIDDLAPLLGTDWLAFWEGEHHEAACAALAAAQAGGEGRFQGLSLTAAGEPRWWDVVITPVPDNQGKPFRLLAISRDITVQKAAEEELRRAKEAAESASRAKGQFLAIMSHELRTPLTGIIGYADLLGSDIWGPTTEEQRAQIARIKAGAWHLVSVIEEILTFSRAEAGKEEVHLTGVDLARIARECAELLRPQADAKGIQLRVELPASPLETRTDAGKLRQIVLNLLGNALKFTDAGHVALSLEQRDGCAVFHVRDTGCGIPADQVEAVFEPFTQVDPSYTRVKGGAGLGLAISRRLARLLGGDVVVEESTPGVGSTFTLRLPLPIQVGSAFAPGAALDARG